MRLAIQGKTTKNIFKKPLINNQIKTSPLRLIDETGKNLGILKLEDALRLANEKKSDLILITDKTSPPICKIIDYGKYLYWQQKKDKEQKKQKAGEIKGIRLTFTISQHDMEIRARQAEKFLKEGNKIKIMMVLRGREKALKEFAKGKISQFLEILSKLIPIKLEGEIKKAPNGFMMIIVKK